MPTSAPLRRAVPQVRRRVLIVDDHNFFAACLRALLDSESDLVVCDVASSSIRLAERIARLRPDLLIVDLTLGTECGLELGRRLRQLQISTPILFVSTLTRPSREQLDGIPRCAFTPKSRRPGEFLAVLRDVLEADGTAFTAPHSGFALNRASVHA